MDIQQALQLINQSVRELAAYHLEPESCTVKLNQNENPWDWPASLKEEMARFCRQRPWNRYPTFIPQDLRAALGASAGVPADGVIVGNGSNEMLLTLLLALMDRERPVVLCQPTFTVYNLLVRGIGGRSETIFLSSRDMRYDVDAILAACRRNPQSLLLLCSPNNPTGCSLTEQDLRRILAVHSGMFVLDQAYVEFGGYNAVPLLAEYPNLLVARTFSKAMSGAGMRLGYLLGRPEMITEINKIKLPYNINFFVERAATLLLAHRSVAEATVKKLVGLRNEMHAFLAALPFDNVYPSDANFIMVRTGRRQELFDFLKGRGVLLRDVSKYPMLEGCLRISIGSPQENAVLCEGLKAFFAGT
jgi:histidinol-phosphate aminotransferase